MYTQDMDDILNDDTILALACNLDDMTGEAMAFAMEILMAEGALDVYATPIIMKKGRPGQILTCLCRPEDEEKMTKLFFLHTTTRGVRVQEMRRHKLVSRFTSQDTPYGEVKLKHSEGYGVHHKKPEYEDLARLAKENHLSLEQIKELLQ